jgi:flagellar M-ring protein FliF
MAPRASETIGQVRKYLGGLNRKQQITLGTGACLVILSLLVFVLLLNRSDYKPLYSGLQPEEAQSIARTLAAANIPYEISSDGTSLRVPGNKLDTVRLDLASQGFPQSGRLGLELFDKPNWAGSDFAERVNYQRALEGELERTIRSIRQVQTARVHLVLPHDSLFTEREREAKASVVVKLREGRLADSAIKSITYLVASAVDHLSPDNVTVIDADGNLPLRASKHQPGVGSDEITEMEKSLSEKLISTLAPVVGAEGLRANVTVEYEMASSETTQETFDPNGSVVLTSQISEDRATDTAAQGIPGTPSNAPGSSAQASAAAAAGAAPGQVGQRAENKTFAVGKSVRHLVQPPGGIKKLAAAVLVDYVTDPKTKGSKNPTRRKRSDEEMKQIEELAKAAIGFDPSRGDHLSVQNISFSSLATELPPPSPSDRLAPFLQEWGTVLRYVGLALLFFLVYFLVVRPVKNQVVATFAAREPQLPTGAPQPAVLQLAGPAGAVTLAEGQGELVDGLLKEPAEASAEVKKALAIKKQLIERVKKDPEAASRLIESWLRQSEA